MAWTTTDLISDVRVRAQVPDDGGDPTDAEILRIATNELRSRFVGIIRSTRENYLVTSADETVVSGTAEYAVPRDAHANGLRDVWIVDSAGHTRALRQVSLTDAQFFGGATGEPSMYYLRGRHVVLLPTPVVQADSLTLRMFYYRSPSALVPVDECAAIVNVTGNVASITYTGYLAVNSFYGVTMDIVQAQSPFALVADGADASLTGSSYTIEITSAIGTSTVIDAGSGWTPEAGDTITQGSNSVTVSSVSTPTIFQVTPGFVLTTGEAFASESAVDFGAVDISEAEAGDYICQHMETCVPQIPDALWPAFVSAVAVQVRLHEADFEGAAAETKQRDELIQAALASMQPRVDGRAKSVINLGSVLRRRRRF